MNEEIFTYGGNNQKIHTPLKKPAYFEYDISDDKPAKKEKKWSFGNLFRRKKKANDSSSDEDVKDKNKKKSDKKKKAIAFDHVVITPSTKSLEIHTYPKDKLESNLPITSQSAIYNKSSTFESHPTHQSTVYVQQSKPRSKTSLDNLSRRSRKDLTKVRAEARRTSLTRNSSSDEDSQRSNSSQKFKSDDSLYKTRDSSCNRRSRAARTERYLKRHSRDGENPYNYIRLSKSDAESTFLRVSDDSYKSPSVSPQLNKSSFSSLSSQTPSAMGLATIPPSHTYHGRFRVSNSTSNPSYKPPLSMNDYNSTAKGYAFENSHVISNNQRSISFDADIHKPREQSEIIYAKLELGKPITKNVIVMNNSQLRRQNNVYQPPAPPPRDPKRLHGSLILDTLNHNNFSEVSSNSARSNVLKDGSSTEVRRMNFVNRPAYKSSSENHIPKEIPITLSQRPSSTTPVTTISRGVSLEAKIRPDNYQYLTDKHPRSRKPIVIQNESKKSTSSRDQKEENQVHNGSKNRSSFLKQLQDKKSNRYSRGSSPQIFDCGTEVRTELFLPSVLPINSDATAKTRELSNGNAESFPQENLDVVNQNNVTSREEESLKTKSANLEDALNELEAIYNSLKLGDEDLLEMAEKREKEVATQKMLEIGSQYQMYNGTRGAFSDSGFSYEPFDSLDSRKRKRYYRKSLKSDDMAFRKLHKPERSATITDPQAVSSKISYLLTSPIHKDWQLDVNLDPNEPDVTLDDVVYRNTKQSNKLNVPEHPPPFGIPLGPITLASNSDYLHAIPKTDFVKHSKIPDLVKDDLAFRNLRKDCTKEPALPPVPSDDFWNNNLQNSPRDPLKEDRLDFTELKKKRAVRSKSANIGSLMSQEVIDRASRRNARDKNCEYKTLTDIADAMQIARQVLKEKDTKILENSGGSFSDTDSLYPQLYRSHSMHKKNGNTVMEKSEETQTIESTQLLSNKSDELENTTILDEILTSLSQNVRQNETRRPILKESTPDPVSPFEDEKLAPLLKTNSFEDVLTALAIEAKEASDKFTQDLEEMDAEKIRSGKEIDDSSCIPKPCREFPESDVKMQSSKIFDDEEETVLESIATIIFSKPMDKTIESDHDYENLASDSNLPDNPPRSANLQNSIAEKIGSIGSGDTEVIENDMNIREYDKKIQDVESQNAAGEECVDVVMSIASSINAPSGMKRTDKPMFNSDCFQFHSLASCSNENSFSKIGSSHNLKSPKLVLESSKLSLNHDVSTEALPDRSYNNVESSSSRNFSDLMHIPDEKTICFFENNPASLAIACSYGIACLYQLAALDLFTILGIVLALFSFIATLFF